MGAVLGLLGFALYIGCVISVAAGVTWAVVKVFPAPKTGDAAEKTG
jgi:hypothetical protein